MNDIQLEKREMELLNLFHDIENDLAEAAHLLSEVEKDMYDLVLDDYAQIYESEEDRKEEIQFITSDFQKARKRLRKAKKNSYLLKSFEDIMAEDDRDFYQEFINSVIRDLFYCQLRLMQIRNYKFKIDLTSEVKDLFHEIALTIVDYHDEIVESVLEFSRLFANKYFMPLLSQRLTLNFPGGKKEEAILKTIKNDVNKYA